MDLKLGDEVFVTRLFGQEVDPPIHGRIIMEVDGSQSHKVLLRYRVRADAGAILHCAESWLVPQHLIISEAPSLTDA